jgi:hypothetical protein
MPIEPTKQYPKYRVIQWIDTSPKAMRRRQATILFGVQAQTVKGGKWMHCYAKNEALIFKSHDEASAAIASITGGKT